VADALAIEASGLFKSFDGKTAVDGVDIQVPEGSIYGILGPNGAGKTTTLRMLLGIIDPDSGERRLLGQASPLDAASLVGYLPEERGLYPAMTARDAIAFMGALRGLPLAAGRSRAEGCSATTALATMSTSRSAPSPRAWRRPCSCSARSSTGRG
jgi:ABC-2 type transport system ATP-binding protein